MPISRSKRLWYRVYKLCGISGTLSHKQMKFITLTHSYADPENLYEELTNKQIKWIDWMYEGYINQNWEDF